MSFTIIHFSDSHEVAQFEHWHSLFDKRLLGFLNNRIRRRTGFGFHDRLIPAAIQRIFAEKPDLVLFTGDAVSCGQSGEFRTALEHFRPLIESDLPFLYIPGNHDAYVTDKSCVKASREFCLAMNRGKIAPEDFPLLMDNGKFRLAAVNCARPVPLLLSCGKMDPETSAFLCREAEKKDGARPLIVAGHFPLLDKHPLLHAQHGLFGAEKAAELLKERKIDLSLCGHVHKPRAELDGSGRGEIVAGSLTGTRQLTKIVYDDTLDVFRMSKLDLEV